MLWEKRLKQRNAMPALMTILLLVGCTPVYIPPAAGPSTAVLDVTVHNLFGQAKLDIDTGVVAKQNLLTTTTLGQAVSVQTTVSTARAVRLVYEEDVAASQCALQFKFQAAPGQSYMLFVGDVAPAAATTGIGKFGQWLFPMAGKGCFAKAWRKQEDGSLFEIPLQRALY